MIITIAMMAVLSNSEVGRPCHDRIERLLPTFSIPLGPTLSTSMFSLVAYFLLLLVLAYLVCKWPPVALAPFLCTFGLEQWIQGISPITVQYAWLTNSATAGLVFLGLLIRAKQTCIRIDSGGIVFLLVILLFSLAFLSISWSPDPDQAVRQWWKTAPYLVVAILASPFLISTAKDLEIAMLSTLVLGANIIFLILLTGSWSHEGRSHLILGNGALAGNPLAIAELSGFVAILAVILRSRFVPQGLHYAAWLIVVPALCLTVRSGSRGQFIGALVAGLFVLLLGQTRFNQRQVVLRWVACGTFIMVGVMTLQYFQTDGFRWQWHDMKYHFTYGRIAPSIELLQAWFRGYPFEWLVGLGNSASFEILGIYPHCVPAEILSEEGILGFLFFMGVLWISITNIFSARRVLCSEPASFNAVMALAGLWFFAVILSMKQGSLLGQPLTYTFAIILARVRWTSVLWFRRTKYAEIQSVSLAAR